MSVSLRARRLRLSAVLIGAVLLLPLGLSPALAQTPSPAAGGTVTGRVVRASADVRTTPGTRHAPRPGSLTWIQPATGPAVRVTGRDAELPLGATVRVSLGGRVAGAAGGAGLPAARQVLAAQVLAPAAPSPALAVTTAPTNDVTVVTVHPAGDTTQDTTTAADVVAAVNGPVADFWSSQSRGSIRIHATAAQAGWLTTTAGCNDPARLFGEVSGDVGFAPGPGRHLLLYLPATIAPAAWCDYGYGEIGSAVGAGGGMYVRDTLTSLIAHEFGHNFGLDDADTVACDDSVYTGDTCTDQDLVADPYDVMGDSWDELGSLSAPEAQELGLLPSGELSDLLVFQGTRTVTLTPMSSTGGTRAIRLRAGRDTYWLEYRNAAGQDAWLDPVSGDNPYGLQTGVTLRHREAGRFYGSTLLDPTPAPEADWPTELHTALPVGRSVWLGDDHYVTVLSMTSTSAVVRVQAETAALPRDLDRNWRPDFVAADPSGVLYRYDGDSMGGFYGRVALGRGWQARDMITMVGDWNGTGAAQDLMARDSSGNLWLYTGPGRDAGFTSATIIGHGWQGMTALFSPGDWNGDGNTDLIARRRDGALLLFPGNGAGGFKASSVIGNGWGAMTAFVPTGDWDLNGTADFIARSSTGALVLFNGDGTGLFAGARVIGNGWNGFSSITGVGDWDVDGFADVLARRTDGTLWLYPGNGQGGFLPPRRISGGWGGYRIAV